MKIGVLGTGDVGQALGRGFVVLGHDVMMGSRDARNERSAAWADAYGPLASTGTFAEAAHFGEVVVLATKGTAYEAVIRAAEAERFHGKVVIDATNPLDFSNGFPPTLAVGCTDSAGEQVQRLLPGAKVVKAFNTVGNALMFRPDLPGGPPDMFICGDDAEAKQVVAGILADFGWGTIDIGGIVGARYLEPMSMVWVLYGATSGRWNHAFKLLRGTTGA